jgi:type IV secretion system protein VirB7
MRVLSALLVSVLLAGCNHPPDLDSPCPDYGKYCSQTPVNVASLF